MIVGGAWHPSVFQDGVVGISGLVAAPVGTELAVEPFVQHGGHVGEGGGPRYEGTPHLAGGEGIVPAPGEVVPVDVDPKFLGDGGKSAAYARVAMNLADLFVGAIGGIVHDLGGVHGDLLGCQPSCWAIRVIAFPWLRILE